MVVFSNICSTDVYLTCRIILSDVSCHCSTLQIKSVAEKEETWETDNPVLECPESVSVCMHWTWFYVHGNTCA